MIKTILLDLDDTLLDFHKAEEVALRETLLRLQLDPCQETIALYSAINKGLWELLEQGRIDRSQILTQRFEQLFARLGVKRSAAEAQEIYGRLLGMGHYFMPGALELLAVLSPRYDLYLASNGSVSVQESRIASAGIARYFKGIFLSQQIGADKPQKAFFDACFQSIPDFTRDSTIIVGDSLTSDISGGIGAGIHTCWYNPSGKPGEKRQDIRPAYEIRHLGELPPLLETIK